MCGIAAIFNSETKTVPGLEELAKDLLTFLQVRGTDATGTAVLSSNMELELAKKAVHASDFLELSSAKAVLAEVDIAYGALLHCRKKTAGGSSHDAAQPFLVENENGDADFAMAHNGTLTTWNSKESVSDSDWLSKEMFKNRKASLSKITGAAALVWTDVRDATHGFFTNGERPLFYGRLKKYDVMVVCSEAELLYAAVSRNNFELLGNKLFKVQPMVMYEVETGDVTKMTTTGIVKRVVGRPAVKRTGEEEWTDDEIEAVYGNVHGRNWGTPAGWVAQTADSVCAALDSLYEKLTVISAEPSKKTELAVVPPMTKIEPEMPTAEEYKAFVALTGSSKPIEAKAVIEFYDEKNAEMYLTVIDLIEGQARGVMRDDAVIMRKVSPAYYAYLEKTFSSVCVALAGLETDNKSAQNFITKGRVIHTSSVRRDNKPAMQVITH